MLAGLAVFSGCSGSESKAMQILKQNEKKWAEQSKLFNQNYTYTMRIGCFCPQDITSPVNVLVMSGKTDSVVYQRDGTPATNEVFASVDTIEDLFTIIRKAIVDKADELNVEYDPILGYPSSISIDPIKTAIDEERGYTVMDFAILK
jgi:hypothetical protein